jgi:hypothetical protein
VSILYDRWREPEDEAGWVPSVAKGMMWTGRTLP